MKILPLDPAANLNREALSGFLEQCRQKAASTGRAQLVSISLGVDALDPLAVLESIFEPTERHFYVERPGEASAVAGAEAVLSFTAEGPERFSACRRFIDETLENTLAVGDLTLPFSGPLFFSAFAFSDSREPGEAFESASVFVPRWQVALRDGRTVAVANLVIDAGAMIAPFTERVWRAHAKFRSFEFAPPDAAADARFSPPSSDSIQGGAGRVTGFASASRSSGDSRADPAGSGCSAIADVGLRSDYFKAVDMALNQISNGLYAKIVLAQARDISAPATFHPLRVLNGLRQRFTDCYAFSVANGRGQSFIGASPERLLRVDAGQLLTEALAGSAPRGTTATADAAYAAGLSRDEKELREHALVLDEVLARLKGLGLKTEHPDKPGLRRYANVQHLHTPVRSHLPENVPAMEVLAKLHPTPAVGGSPREATLPRIRAMEGFPRGLYAGALGWLDCRGNAEFFVGLRSALIDGQRARVYAGSGIVKGSDPEKEAAEIELKFKAMQDALLG